MSFNIEERGIAKLYERGVRALHLGCPIVWDIVPLYEWISSDPPKFKRTLVPLIPDAEKRRSSAKCV